jgi:adenosylcobinamide-GDP ribazoletransferase
MTTQRDDESQPAQNPPMESAERAPAQWPGWLAATAQAIRFYSRLPVPLMPGETEQHAAPDFRIMPRALPLAALVIAMPAMLVAAGTQALGLTSLISAALILTTLTLTSGAFHEDGLADTADGLFGGHSIERRLAIMKDSLIGSFGASALILAYLLRLAGLVSILDEADIAGTCAAIAIAAIWSRSLGIHLLAVDAPARAYGALATVGMPTVRTAMITLALAAAMCGILAWAGGLPLSGLINALALATLLALGLAALARRLIGGPTGDIAGAAQQLAEIAVYVGLAVALA